MTPKYAIAFSLILTVVFSMPPSASAQFNLGLQTTEIANQVRQLANRITRYTTLLNQFTSLDCAAQGMGASAEATPINEAPVVCDTLNMIGAFRDSYQQLLQAPANLRHTPVPLPDWRNVLQAADTLSVAHIQNIYQSDPAAAANAVAAYERQRESADRRMVLAHAESDAVAALSDTLDEAERVVADLEARNSVTGTGLAQTQTAATLTRGRLIVALSQLRAHQISAAAATAYNAEVVRREAEARRLAERAALEARWAQERAIVAAAANQRIQSMYGGYQIPAGLGGNPNP